MKKIVKIFAAALMISIMFGTPLFAEAAEQNYASVFNADYYYNKYPDLQTAIGRDADKLLNHFITSGMREGRRASEEFNVWAYMTYYPDLQAAFGNADLTAYYNHYIKSGKAEGRKASGDVIGNSGENVPKSIEAKNVVATYTTKYRTKTSRASNLELAASRINGYTIAPGETFSFGDSILSRTEANGYLSAPSFADGEVVTSIGGGICQVSSTLYAALKSYGIPVAERHVHSRPVDYVPEGYDATISEGRKDLKFTNTYKETLCIATSAVGGNLTITIYKNEI